MVDKADDQVDGAFHRCGDAIPHAGHGAADPVPCHVPAAAECGVQKFHDAPQQVHGDVDPFGDDSHRPDDGSRRELKYLLKHRPQSADQPGSHRRKHIVPEIQHTEADLGKKHGQIVPQRL